MWLDFDVRTTGDGLSLEEGLFTLARNSGLKLKKYILMLNLFLTNTLFSLHKTLIDVLESM